MHRAVTLHLISAHGDYAQGGDKCEDEVLLETSEDEKEKEWLSESLSGEVDLDLVKRSYAQMLHSSGLRLVCAAVSKRVTPTNGVSTRSVLRLCRSLAPCPYCTRPPRHSYASMVVNSYSGNSGGGTMCRRCR